MSNINTIIENLTHYLARGSNDVECNTCCPECGEVYVFASTETFLQWAEAMGLTVSEGDPPIISETPCCYERCITELYDYLGSIENIDRIVDKGIEEYSTIQGKSFICLLLDFARENDLSGNDLSELLGVILDEGIVVSCIDGNTVVAGVAIWVTWGNFVGFPVITAENACCLTTTASLETYLNAAEALGWLPYTPPA
jgi:hypothetical protein